MEELGVFKRIREYFPKSLKEATDSSLLGPRHSMIQRGYSMLSQMVQRDPAYYAVLVACRPDQNWRLIHNPRKCEPNATFDNDDVAFGVPMDRIKLLVQGAGTSDIQSTVVFPTFDDLQTIRLVPGFHRQLHSWLRSSLEMKYGDKYERFGQAQDLAVQSGDLVICLPQILRWPKAFSLPNLFNLSQSGLDTGLRTTSLESSERSKTKSSSNTRDQSEQERHDAYGEAQQCHFYSNDQDSNSWCGVSGAIAEALAGRLEWTSSRAVEERTCILGTHGASAVELVQRSRAQLAERFHKIFDSIENDLNVEPGIKNCT